MKSRQRYFNAAVLGKDISRFAPVWCLYLVGGLMVSLLPLLGYERGSWEAERIAAVNLSAYLEIFSLINLVYGAIVAQLLFGDMFSARLCNALHAMPLRREGWFLTHLLSGVLFSLVPNFLGCLAFMPFLGSAWYVSFLWLLGMMLQYLFFFGVGVLAMHVSGNRFAAFVVYGIINFGALLVLWLAEMVYVPFLYGIRVDAEQFYLFMPVVSLLSRKYFSVRHEPSCDCMAGKAVNAHSWVIEMGDSWLYMGVLTAVGLICMAVALLLYRRRRLETAGSFLAFRPLRPVFQVIFSLSAASFCYLLPGLFAGGEEPVMLLFFFIGLVVGFFVSQMFIDRTVRVFRGKSFLRLGILLIVLVASVVLTWLDPLRVVTASPAAAQVETVYLFDRSLNWWDIKDNLEMEEERSVALKISDTDRIEKLRQLHKLLAQAGEPEYGRPYQYITIHYQLKGGATLTRFYEVNTNTEAFEALQAFMCSPEAVFGVSGLEQLQERVLTIKGADHTGWKYDKVLLADLWQDCLDGNMSQMDASHLYCGYAGKKTVYLSWKTSESTKEQLTSLEICGCCTNSYRRLDGLPENLLYSGHEESLLLRTERIVLEGERAFFNRNDQREIIRMLKEDLALGALAAEGKAPAGWVMLELMPQDLSQDVITFYLDPERSAAYRYCLAASQ